MLGPGCRADWFAQVTLSSALLECNPGNTTQAEFIVQNFGLQSTFTVLIADDLQFLQNFSPNTFIIGENQSQVVVAEFSVPSSIQFGTVATVTVTAKSAWDGTVNSASVPLTVVPAQQDQQPPECRLEEDAAAVVPCRGTAMEHCSEDSWTLTALLSDTNSGLGDVRGEHQVPGRVCREEHLALCCAGRGVGGPGRVLR